MTEMIAAALRDKAEGDIHVERLLSAVHTGVRRRRRRNLLGTACAVVAVAVLAAGGGVVSSMTRGAPVRPASVGDIARPPRVDGAPVASFTPSSLGSDPTLFHLDLTGLSGWGILRWSSRAGYEDLRGFSADAGGEFYIEASQIRDKLSGQGGEISPTEVNGLPAEAVRITMPAGGFSRGEPRGTSAVRWEAVPDLWVQVVVPGGPEVAIRIAERVRLDRTYRCAVPFRLSGLGDKVRVIKCETWFSGGQALGGVWLNKGAQTVDYTEYYVGIGRAEPTKQPTESIDGRAVAVFPAETGVIGATARIEYPYGGGVGYFFSYYTTTDDPFLRSLVTAFQPITDPDVNTWPRSPLP
jgi:hypothetical protein